MARRSTCCPTCWTRALWPRPPGRKGTVTRPFTTWVDPDDVEADTADSAMASLLDIRHQLAVAVHQDIRSTVEDGDWTAARIGVFKDDPGHRVAFHVDRLPTGRRPTGSPTCPRRRRPAYDPPWHATGCWPTCTTNRVRRCSPTALAAPSPTGAPVHGGRGRRPLDRFRREVPGVTDLAARMGSTVVVTDAMGMQRRVFDPLLPASSDTPGVPATMKVPPR